MRKLTDHIVSGDQAPQLIIETVGEPGPGGAPNEYSIKEILIDESGTVAGEMCRIEFQIGAIREAGINGISHEALLAIVLDRLRAYQEGPYRCRENAVAITKGEEMLMWLQRRTVERIKRGVEGTMAV